MKRSPELAALSRDHHAALAAALVLRRAEPATLAAAADRFLTFFARDGEAHFTAEEDVLVGELPPEVARRLLDEHVEIRRLVRELRERPDVDVARGLGALMAAHVRFEEREAFPLLEEKLPPGRLAELGAQLERRSP